MNLSVFKNAFNLLYTDRMDIYRTIEETSIDGTTNVVSDANPIYKDIKCRISFSDQDSAETSLEDRNPIHLNVKIFCGPEVDLQKGDKLILNRLNDDGSVMTTYSGIVNLPLVYPTHLEAQIIEVGDA